MQLSFFLVSISLTAAVHAAPDGVFGTLHRPRALSGSASYSAPTPSTIRPDACATVSSLSKAFRKTAAATATATVPAEIAYECINSVPFNTRSDLTWIGKRLCNMSRTRLPSTLRRFSHPMTSMYVHQPFHFYVPVEANICAAYSLIVQAEFDRIYLQAQAGSYAGEYDFGFDLYRSMQHVHDGHFVYYPDSVTLIFSFARSMPLVSVSLDGMSLPEVYVYADVLAMVMNNATFTPSPLTMINGQDSTKWLLDFSENGSLQDRDALWNNMFWINAQVSLGPRGTGPGTFAGGGRGRWIYPGANTTLTFANGSTVTTENYANVLSPFRGIQNGADLRKKYFTAAYKEEEPAITLAMSSSTVPSSSSAAPTMTVTTTTATLPAPGYPTPVIREMNNLNSGYFLEGEGYDDVAVLSVPSFVGLGTDELDFQQVNTYLINQAVAAGKTKLIIDVSANGGGTILQGYDLFKQLFPSILPDGYTRFRAHEALNLIGQEVSYYSGMVPRSLNDTRTEINRAASSYNYRTDANIAYEPFPSWPSKYGPHAHGPMPDNYTSIIRWNLSDVLTPINSGGIYVSGYLQRANITKQPFAPENIVVVHDGYCASTCTIFSELMTAQGGVKTIALGGRPNKDIIQAVGGVKGTNDFPYGYILDSVKQPFKLHHYHSEAYYQNSTVLGTYNDLAILRSTDAVVNARDGIRKGDAGQTPLQFVYQPADCRIYYTPEMVIDETAVWKTVADTAFNGISHCVAGSYPGASTNATLGARVKHRVRGDVDVREHWKAMAEVRTGMDGVKRYGDGFMIP